MVIIIIQCLTSALKNIKSKSKVIRVMVLGMLSSTDGNEFLGTLYAKAASSSHKEPALQCPVTLSCGRHCMSTEKAQSNRPNAVQLWHTNQLVPSDILCTC
jgi:hypothetical protein